MLNALFALPYGALIASSLLSLVTIVGIWGSLALVNETPEPRRAPLWVCRSLWLIGMLAFVLLGLAQGVVGFKIGFGVPTANEASDLLLRIGLGIFLACVFVVVSGFIALIISIKVSNFIDFSISSRQRATQPWRRHYP